MELGDSEKVSSVISLSNHAYDETKRYRDHVWKLLVWTIGLLVGVLAAARTTPGLATCPGKVLSSIFIFIVAVCGVWDIYFDYKQFVWNRNVLRRCERSLQFYDRGAYAEGTILPEAWKSEDYHFKQCLPHFLQWIFVIVVAAAYSIYALCVL